ncbi:CHAT domain-containing protein, partial [Streptomyces sp. URMC 129]|uniref:CHAT domain-containing protein n=1 Tax=Streptomyces sp. URMC 129 TaxID=3423407 RepID=UPI003F1CAFFC
PGPGPGTGAPPARYHVLYLGASPTGQQVLRADRGLREVQDAARAGGRLRVTAYPAARTTDLRNVLTERPRPHILHLACHGVDGRLVFEDPFGEEHRLDARQVADTLRLYRSEYGIRLRGLVLASCDSADVVALFEGSADTVVAHTGPLDDLCANVFAGEFYRALQLDGNVRAAARVAAQHAANADDSCSMLRTGLVVLPDR